jgi:hypothetical protein
MRNKAQEGATMGEQNLPRFEAESAGGGIEAGEFLRRGKLLMGHIIMESAASRR